MNSRLNVDSGTRVKEVRSRFATGGLFLDSEAPSGGYAELPLSRGRSVRLAGSWPVNSRRQQDFIEMIASENFTPRAVLEAVGSVLTNKYAEGLPGARYYHGCQMVDQVETVAIERAKALYGAEHANVQPHSGAQANQAVYVAAVPSGANILSMRLDHGGHLTHGLKVELLGAHLRSSPLCTVGDPPVASTTTKSGPWLSRPSPT